MGRREFHTDQMPRLRPMAAWGSKSAQTMKRENRTAWGLAGLLAVMLVGDLLAIASYGQRAEALSVQWQPVADWREWWVGKRDLVMKSCGPTGSRATLAGQTYSLGII